LRRKQGRAGWLARYGSLAGDPSLRLKSGSARDDEVVIQESNCITTKAGFFRSSIDLLYTYRF
jgi:hypothetical protein